MWDYITITHKAGDSLFVAYHPELPSVFAQGRTPEEAEAHLGEATQIAMAHLAENDLPIPPAMTMEAAQVQLGRALGAIGYWGAENV